ncbi:MAG: c-type cytochrome [Chloroflexota bacterium]
MKRFLFLLMLLAVGVSACARPQPSATSESSATLAAVPSDYAGLDNPFGVEDVSEGQALYKTNCATCHGEAGRGDGSVAPSLNPRPVDLVKLNEAATDDYLFWRISTGSAGTAMAGWKGILSEEQIWKVIAALRAMK